MSESFRKFNSIKFEILVLLVIGVRTYLNLFSKKFVCGVYCDIAINFGKTKDFNDFDNYFMMKSLNALIANAIFRIFRIEALPPQANTVLMLIGVLEIYIFVILWRNICKHYNLANVVKNVGLIACVFNPVVSYWHFAYQEIPDNSQLLFTALALRVVISRKKYLVWPVYFVSCLVSLQSSILLIVLYAVSSPNSNKLQVLALSRPLNLFEKFVKSHNLTFKLTYLISLPFISTALILHNFVYGLEQRLILIVLGVIMHGFYITLVFSFLVKLVVPQIRVIYSNISAKKIMVFLLVIAEISKYIIFSQIFISEDQVAASSFVGSLVTIMWFFEQGAFWPGLSPLAFVNTFGFVGLIVILMYFRFPKLDFRLSSSHLPSIAALLIFFPILIESETRHHVFLVPIFVILCSHLIILFENYMGVVLVMGLISSRVYVLNPEIVEESDWAGLRFGPWFLPESLFISLIIFGAYLAFVFPILKRRMPKESLDLKSIWNSQILPIELKHK